MPRFEREKGARFEREVARVMAEIWQQSRRNLEAPGASGDHGIDVIGAGPFVPQVKRRRKYAPVNCIFEVDEDAVQPGQVPLLITKGDYLPSMVVMRFDDFMGIARLLNDLSGGKLATADSLADLGI